MEALKGNYRLSQTSINPLVHVLVTRKKKIPAVVFQNFNLYNSCLLYYILISGVKTMEDVH